MADAFAAVEWTRVIGSFACERPELLVCVSVSLLCLGRLAVCRGPWRVRVPAVASSEVEPGPSADLAWRIGMGLRVLVLILLGLALAGPSIRLPEQPAAGSGVDLVIALDASGSMEALDGQLDGARVTRLELAKRAVAELIRERAGDRIGLVVFGQRAYTQCPLTLDHDLVLRALARVRIGDAGDSTAIGDAVGLAVRRLRADGARSDAERVLVLLTDGRQNSGEISPTTGARLAVREGIRAHTVGIGTSGVVPFASERSPQPLRFERIDLDREALIRLAQATGGEFFAARRPEDVLAVADSIHRLEARPIQELGPERQVSAVPWILWAALLALGLDASSQYALLRRLP